MPFIVAIILLNSLKAVLYRLKNSYTKALIAHETRNPLELTGNGTDHFNALYFQRCPKSALVDVQL